MTASWRKWAVILLVLPVVIREFIDMFTDVATFQQNGQLVNKIISYLGAEHAGLPVRAVHSVALCKAVAALFVVFHAAMALMLLLALIAWLYQERQPASQDVMSRNSLSLALVLYIVLYVVLFAVIAGDYFMAQLQGIDFSLPILCSALLPAIALFLLQAED